MLNTGSSYLEMGYCIFTFQKNENYEIIIFLHIERLVGFITQQGQKLYTTPYTYYTHV